MTEVYNVATVCLECKETQVRGATKNTMLNLKAASEKGKILCPFCNKRTPYKFVKAE